MDEMAAARKGCKYVDVLRALEHHLREDKLEKFPVDSVSKMKVLDKLFDDQKLFELLGNAIEYKVFGKIFDDAQIAFAQKAVTRGSDADRQIVSVWLRFRARMLELKNTRALPAEGLNGGKDTAGSRAGAAALLNLPDAEPAPFSLEFLKKLLGIDDMTRLITAVAAKTREQGELEFWVIPWLLSAWDRDRALEKLLKEAESSMEGMGLLRCDYLANLDLLRLKFGGHPACNAIPLELRAGLKDIKSWTTFTVGGMLEDQQRMNDVVNCNFTFQ